MVKSGSRRNQVCFMEGYHLIGCLVRVRGGAAGVKLKAEGNRSQSEQKARKRKKKKMLKLRHQVVRRVVCQRAALEWDALSNKLTDPRARAALDSLRNVHAEIRTEAREYVKEPEPLDFEHYRSVIKNKDLVDALEVLFFAFFFGLFMVFEVGKKQKQKQKQMTDQCALT